MGFWQGFSVITIVHLLAAVSPGPDFIMVTQQTLLYGKRTGWWCSLGIALGLGVHIAYSIFGLATAIGHSLLLLQAIKLAGASYLLYMGWQSLRSKVDPDTFHVMRTEKSSQQLQSAPTLRQSLAKGFFCNLLNPKAPLYFISLLTVVISPNLPTTQLVLYGLWMMILQLAWCMVIAFLLSRPRLQSLFKRYSRWIDRACGTALILLGIKMLFP